MSNTYHAKGKLLLSGEYFVLDGALALALPLKFGQGLSVEKSDNALINWKSYETDETCWFNANFDCNSLELLTKSDDAVGERLQDLLKLIRKEKPKLFDSEVGYRFKTTVDFNRSWGLGTSSTLIHLLAEWSGTDPYQLLDATFGGSGYDLACAAADGPILYQRQDKEVKVDRVKFSPSFSKNLYFAYLGKKKNSRDGIARYRKLSKQKSTAVIDKITVLTKEMAAAKTLKDFNKIIVEHEDIVSDNLDLSQAKDLFFSDFDGEVKSLGAWGGDFVLLSTKLPEEKIKTYLNEKKLQRLFKYDDIVFKK